MAQPMHDSDIPDDAHAFQAGSTPGEPEWQTLQDQPPLSTGSWAPPTCLSLWSSDDTAGVVVRTGDLHPYDAAKTYVVLLHGIAMATGHSDADRFERLVAELDVLAPMLNQVAVDMQSEVVEGFHDGIQEMLNDLVVAPLMAMHREDG